jgi:hypothetical protein
VSVYYLSNAQLSSDPKPTYVYRLPDQFKVGNTFGAPVVGFMDFIGAAVYSNGALYYWDGSGAAKTVDFQKPLKNWLVDGLPPIAEISGGKLIIKRPLPRRPDINVMQWQALLFDGAAVTQMENTQISPQPVDLPPVAFGERFPIISDSTDSGQYLAMVSAPQAMITLTAIQIRLRLNVGARD